MNPDQIVQQAKPYPDVAEYIDRKTQAARKKNFNLDKVPKLRSEWRDETDEANKFKRARGPNGIRETLQLMERKKIGDTEQIEELNKIVRLQGTYECQQCDGKHHDHARCTEVEKANHYAWALTCFRRNTEEDAREDQMSDE